MNDLSYIKKVVPIVELLIKAYQNGLLNVDPKAIVEDLIGEKLEIEMLIPPML